MNFVIQGSEKFKNRVLLLGGSPFKALIVHYPDSITEEPESEWLDMFFVNEDTDELHDRMFEVWKMFLEARREIEQLKYNMLTQQRRGSVADASVVAEAESGSPMRLHRQKNNGHK